MSEFLVSVDSTAAAGAGVASIFNAGSDCESIFSVVAVGFCSAGVGDGSVVIVGGGDALMFAST